MIIVIADDITGAAEIAGIAHRYGLRVLLSIDEICQGTGSKEVYDVMVIATDSRSYSSEQAAEITSKAARSVCSAIEGIGTEHILFRKTDSALRGNVMEELQVLTDVTIYETVVYMPANPSKGRIIRNGVYLIDNTPISETPFSYDPEFPALTSSVSERFPGLYCPDAVCKDDIDMIVSKVLASKRKTLLAGAADLFCSLVEKVFSLSPVSGKEFSGIPKNSHTLLVCGSTQSKNLSLGLLTEPMPIDVFYGQEEPRMWAKKIENRYLLEKEKNGNTRRGTILTIGDKEVRKGKEAAVYLRNAMAEVCCGLLSASLPDELVIEGGATAFAILQHMPWQSFLITNEVSPGVVRMKIESENLHITLKPGSYDWGELWK